MEWFSTAGQEVASLTGRVNGTECTIIPDTEVDITIVPGNLVFANQLLDDYELVRGMSGMPVKVQCAMVPIAFEGREYMLKVAVANWELLNESVLFTVPLAEETIRQLFLGGASEADTSGVEHSCKAPDSPSVMNAKANTTLIAMPAGQQCLAVTRVAAKQNMAAKSTRDREALEQVCLSAVPEVITEVHTSRGVDEPLSATRHKHQQCSQPAEVSGAASQTALLTKAGRVLGSQVSTVGDTRHGAEVTPPAEVSWNTGGVDSFTMGGGAPRGFKHCCGKPTVGGVATSKTAVPAAGVVATGNLKPTPLEGGVARKPTPTEGCVACKTTLTEGYVAPEVKTTPTVEVVAHKTTPTAAGVVRDDRPEESQGVPVRALEGHRPLRGVETISPAFL